MIGSICIGIGIVVIMIVVVHIAEKIQHGHSKGYYIYMENNGRPPPPIDEYFDYILYKKLL